MPNQLQRYQIRITRQSTGKWVVTGYWEVQSAEYPGNKMLWNLDGAAKEFDTRREALEFVSNQNGIPE